MATTSDMAGVVVPLPKRGWTALDAQAEKWKASPLPEEFREFARELCLELGALADFLLRTTGSNESFVTDRLDRVRCDLFYRCFPEVWLDDYLNDAEIDRSHDLYKARALEWLREMAGDA